MKKTSNRWIMCGLVLVGLVVITWTAGLATAQTEQSAERTTTEGRSDTYATRSPDSTERYASSELEQGRWHSGGSIGFLGGTPDETAMAMNANADYFVADHVSFGPLAQFAFTGDMFQVGLSGQGKYWIDVPGTNGRGHMALESGIGFVHADFGGADTSWLVPIGIGYEHALNSGMDLTTTALVNFTNLHTGRGGDADVMPGVAFGLRF